MKAKDIIFLIVWAALPPAVLLIWQGNFLVSSVLYLVIPSAYFSFHAARVVLPRALTMATTSIVLVIVLDYIAFLNNAWTVPTVFPVRFFTFIPVEDFFFTFWAVYVVVAAFAYFFPHLPSSRMDAKRVEIAEGITLLALGAFLLFYFFKQEWLVIPYYYAWLVALFFIFPSVLLFMRFPAYRGALVRVALYSTCLMLPYEIVANMLGFWFFPSQEYLGMVAIMGQRFPIEEFLTWMIFFAPTTIAFTKFMTDGASPREEMGA